MNIIIEKVILSLMAFRKNMRSELFFDDVQKLYGDAVATRYCKKFGLSHKKDINEVENRKIEYARGQLNNLLIFDWVKFVGITGSVGAGIAKNDDDIDILIVLKNNTLWIYRLLHWVKSFGSNKIRRLGVLGVNKVGDKKDVLCINILCEERGLEFEEQDIFTLHEIFHIIPIYNERYYSEILYYNLWISEKYCCTAKPSPQSSLKTNENAIKALAIKTANLIAFLGQSVVMALHGFSFKKSWNSFKKGCVYFFPNNSRVKYKIPKNALEV